MVSGLFLVVVLLGGNLFAFLPAMLASREVRRFCGGLAEGTPLYEVRSLAVAGGYGFEQAVGGHVVVEHPRSLGRAYCDLGFDAGGRLASKKLDN